MNSSERSFRIVWLRRYNISFRLFRNLTPSLTSFSKLLAEDSSLLLCMKEYTVRLAQYQLQI